MISRCDTVISCRPVWKAFGLRQKSMMTSSAVEVTRAKLEYATWASFSLRTISACMPAGFCWGASDMSLLLEDGDRPGRAPLPRGRPARLGYYQRRGGPTGSAFLTL